MSTQTYYDILGVAVNAEPEIIHAAYQTLARKYADSTDPKTAQMARLLEQAYAVLSDPIKRADYDAWLRLNQSAANPYAQPPASTQPTAPAYAPVGVADYRVPKKSNSAAAWVIGLIIALFAVVGVAYYLVSQTGFFGEKEAQVEPISTPEQNNQLQPLKPVNTEPVVSVEQQNARNRAHADYLAAVNRINDAWQSLPKNTRNALRDEQRAINARRESECQTEAASRFTAPIEIETARYLCEVPQLDERTEQLRVYAQSEWSSYTPNYEDSQPEYVEEYDNYDDPVYSTKPAEARALYDEAVANINAVWNSLSDETREALRDEQRAINANREANCKAYARSTYSSKPEQDTARYLCEVPELDSRAAELREYY